MRKIFTLSFLLVLVVSVNSQVVLSKWKFDGDDMATAPASNPSFLVGDAVADSGMLVTGSSCLGSFHTSTASVWSAPVGNGSTDALSSNGWAIGDYYEFKFSTLDFYGINLSWDVFGSNTGPRDFKVQYSTDGTAFTDATGTNATYVVLNTPTFAAGTYNAIHNRVLDLSTITAIANQPFVWIRFVVTSAISTNGGAIALTGTSRIDNVKISASGALPVSILSFEAQKSNGKNELIWKVAQETDLNHYEIERSNDGRTYSSIGKVNAVNNSTYTFTDAKPASLNYYRIKLVDKNGKFNFTKVVVLVNKDNGFAVGNVYPTVTKDIINVEVFAAANTRVQYTISSLSGQKMMSKSAVVSQFAKQTIDVSSLAAGMYMLQVSGSDGQKTFKIIKQ
jgi:Secretion system C-terminal sorting domain